MADLQYYTNQKAIINNQIAGLIALLGTLTLKPIDMAHIIKSIEIMNIDVSGYRELTAALNAALLRMSTLELSSADRLYVARALTNDLSTAKPDEQYANIHGDIEVGDRTFENFSDRILEQYYKGNETC